MRVRALPTLALVISVGTALLFTSNLIWLARSTARIKNHSGNELRNLRLDVGRQQVTLDTLQPGQSRFVFLPDTGDATLIVSYASGTDRRTGCQEYVEGSMYHVDVVIAADLEPRCDVNLPVTNSLFWIKALGVID